jgi:hypothetical protein
MVIKKCSVQNNGFEIRDASLPGYELGIELGPVFGIGSCRILARMELQCEEKASCVI